MAQKIEEEKTTVVENDEEMDPPVERPSGFRIIAYILILLIIIGVVGYLVYRSRSKNNTTPQNTADQIRQSFTPTGTAPSFNPPAPSSEFGGGPTTTAPTTTPASPPATTPPVTRRTVPVTPRQATPRQTVPAPSAQPVVYTNDSLGFALTIPGNWVVDDKQNPNRVVFFSRTTGQMVGYIEVYPGINIAGVQDLAATLQGSPSVAGVSQTTVAGQPALAYTASSGYTSGVATVFNSRVYYFHGSLTSGSVLTSFRFI